MAPTALMSRAEPRLDDANAVPVITALATSGVSDGFAWNSRAATPETIAAAWEVPDPLKYESPMRAAG